MAKLVHNIIDLPLLLRIAWYFISRSSLCYCTSRYYGSILPYGSVGHGWKEVVCRYLRMVFPSYSLFRVIQSLKPFAFRAEAAVPCESGTQNVSTVGLRRLHTSSTIIVRFNNETSSPNLLAQKLDDFPFAALYRFHMY